MLIMLLLAFAPISELRGAIPYGIISNISPILVISSCILVNALVAPFVLFFLDTLHRYFYKIKFYKIIFDRFIVKARLKISSKVERWGYWGLTLFVAIPLPITGAWTGSLGAWALNLNKLKTYLAVFLGVFIAGLIVSLISIFGIEPLNFLLKELGHNG